MAERSLARVPRGCAGTRPSSRGCGSCSTRERRRGVRHGLASVLTVTVLAALAGAGNFRQAGGQAADPLPCPCLPNSCGGWPGPHQPTIGSARAAERGHDPPGGAEHRRRACRCAGGKTVRNSAAPGGIDVRLFAALLHRKQVVTGPGPTACRLDCSLRRLPGLCPSLVGLSIRRPHRAAGCGHRRPAAAEPEAVNSYPSSTPPDNPKNGDHQCRRRSDASRRIRR
jgi:hypothetical protein